MNFSHVYRIPPPADWLHLLMLSGGILVLILISEFTRKKLQWRQEVTRKIVHISVGLLLLLTPLLLETSLPLLLIAVFFTIFNFIALRKNLLPGIHIDRQNLGTVYYAFSFLVLILLFWDNYKIIIIAAMMVMAVGDASAAIVGQSVRNPHRYRLIQDTKSLEGSLSMFLVSTVAIFITFMLYPPNLATLNHSVIFLLLFAMMTAVVAAVAEALGNRGNDNLSVPLMSGIVLYFLLSNGYDQHLQFLLGMILAAVTIYLSNKARFLTPSGGISAFLLACIIFGFGGWKWTIPILVFFLLSSLLSKLGKSSQEGVFEKGSRRDHVQVFANGGIAGLFMIIEILNPGPVNYLVYLGALAAATADTWATEVGMMAGQQPRLISSLKVVPSGTSGGVTLAGLGGALIGSFMVAISGFVFLPDIFSSGKIHILLIITLSGLLASMVDSLLGATLQVRYQCTVCHKMTEKRTHCSGQVTLITGGLTWFSNDVVNFFNTLSGAILAILGIYLIH